ncbi:MAG TPA: hypothetical protein VM166_05540 [Gemmatimonadaceae bacterium]|nr:hypothetical protein [Gemmatimonadaceae bacterium]
MTLPRPSESLTVAGSRDVIMQPPPPQVPRSDEISVVSVVNVLLRHRVMIVMLMLAFGFYNGFKSITSAKHYTVESQFLVKGSRSGGGQLGGLAAQLGINIGGGDAGQNPQFYLDLLEAKAILWPVAQMNYTVKTDSGVRTGNLIKIFNIKDPRPNVARAKVIDALKGAISSSSSLKTGVITVVVRSGRPDLAVQISSNLLNQVNLYNLSRRQEQAAGEKAFVQRQVDEKQAELRQAETDLKNFLESNRMYASSPELMLERTRLMRRVDMRNLLYTSMLQSYEQARIDEMRDLPVISIIEAPEMPIQNDPRGGVKKTLIGLAVGLVLGIVIAFFREKMAANKEAQTDEFVEFAQLRKAAVGDLTHPWRPVARVFRTRRNA